MRQQFNPKEGGNQMPWKADDATNHTHKADTPKKRRMWAKIANDNRKIHGDDARAIREANAAIERMK